MPNIIAAKTPDGSLMPLHEYEDDLQYIGQGEMVNVKVTRSRNIWMHRRFMAMCRALWNLDQVHKEFKSIEEVIDQVKISAGHCTVRNYASGDEKYIVKTPKSIAFANMDDTEFNAFYNRAVDGVLRDILPEYQPDDFLDYLDQFSRF